MVPSLDRDGAMLQTFQQLFINNKLEVHLGYNR